MITAALIIVSLCLLAMTGTAMWAVKDAHDQYDARRIAEVALAHASEGLMKAERDWQTAENLHKAERERADFLEEQLHDSETLLATGRPAGGNSRERLSLALSAAKRIANLAAGPDRTRTAPSTEPPAVLVATPAGAVRGAGDGPTKPGAK
jgi:hypothetical protein